MLDQNFLWNLSEKFWAAAKLTKESVWEPLWNVSGKNFDSRKGLWFWSQKFSRKNLKFLNVTGKSDVSWSFKKGFDATAQQLMSGRIKGRRAIRLTAKRLQKENVNTILNWNSWKKVIFWICSSLFRAPFICMSESSNSNEDWVEERCHLGNLWSVWRALSGERDRKRSPATCAISKELRQVNQMLPCRDGNYSTYTDTEGLPWNTKNTVTKFQDCQIIWKLREMSSEKGRKLQRVRSLEILWWHRRQLSSGVFLNIITTKRRTSQSPIIWTTTSPICILNSEKLTWIADFQRSKYTM